MQAQFLNSIHDISSECWDGLTGHHFPFLRHAFLAALEDSGCADIKAGWQAHHLVLSDEQKNQKAVLVMPWYLKVHSFGEYVFDGPWAQAWQAYGMTYYPKLLNAIPFSPVTGPRWGVKETTDECAKSHWIKQAFQAIKQEAQRLELSSVHSLFNSKADSKCLLDSDFMQRSACHFQWINRDYRSFEDFLSTFSSRKRKQTNKERYSMRVQGITVEMLEGEEIQSNDWEQFYQCYHLTYLKRSGQPGYLNRDFFYRLETSQLQQSIVMARAKKENKLVAVALYFKDETALYGRYWGCKQEFEFLHFEACYYQGIEYAIRHGLKRFDPGVQGEHKLQRGFEPILTQSHHWLNPSCPSVSRPEQSKLIADRLQQSIADFLAEEKKHVLLYQQYAKERLPFKQKNSSISAQ